MFEYIAIYTKNTRQPKYICFPLPVPRQKPTGAAYACGRNWISERVGKKKKQHKMCCAVLTSKLPPPNHLDEHNPNGEVCYREVRCAG